MKISTAHQRFADLLYHQTALEYIARTLPLGSKNTPEYFLGPNWKDVLNFWIYLDTLSAEDLWIVFNRYLALGCVDPLKDLTRNAAENTIGEYYTLAAWNATPTVASAHATLELIGSHNLKSLKFLPLFLNP